MSDDFLIPGILRREHNNLFSDSRSMLPFNRLKGNVNAGCPDIQAPSDSSIFNEVGESLIKKKKDTLLFLAWATINPLRVRYYSTPRHQSTSS